MNMHGSTVRGRGSFYAALGAGVSDPEILLADRRQNWVDDVDDRLCQLTSEGPGAGGRSEVSKPRQHGPVAPSFRDFFRRGRFSGLAFAWPERIPSTNQCRRRAAPDQNSYLFPEAPGGRSKVWHSPRSRTRIGGTQRFFSRTEDFREPFQAVAAGALSSSNQNPCSWNHLDEPRSPAWAPVGAKTGIYFYFPRGRGAVESLAPFDRGPAGSRTFPPRRYWRELFLEGSALVLPRPKPRRRPSRKTAAKFREGGVPHDLVAPSPRSALT